MKMMTSLKKAAFLRKLTALKPVFRNKTRWSSTYAMLSRYFELRPFFNRSDPDLHEFLLYEFFCQEPNNFPIIAIIYFCHLPIAIIYF